MAEMKKKLPSSGALTPVYTWNEKFRYEIERRQTFELWPLKWLDIKILAMTGMIYTGVGKRTMCFFCEVIIGNWDDQNDPVKVHLRFSPNCPLLRRRAVNNMPCNVDELDKLLLSIGQNLKQIPDYSLENVRLATYGEWPQCMKQKPELMAEAGFYYRGISDHVVCFNCNMGLKQWEPEDDPWEQHALWMPYCNFVRLKKGHTFIEIVRNKFSKSAQNINIKKKNLPPVMPASEVYDNELCKICFANECDTVYVPCGHVVCCTKCNSFNHKCPVCESWIVDRKAISKHRKLFSWFRK